MIMHFASQVLAILADVSHHIKKQALQDVTPAALVDAQPMALPWEAQYKQTALLESHAKKDSKAFQWYGIDFDPRMVVIPVLVSLYWKWQGEVSYEELGHLAHTPVNSTKINKIATKFKDAWKPVPFKNVYWKWIRFIYDAQSPETIARTDDVPSDTPTDLPENAFLDAPFDPQLFMQSKPLQLKTLSWEILESVTDLDGSSMNILKTLLEQTRAIRIADLAKQCKIEVAEVNAYLPNIMNTLWIQWFSVRIATQSDHIHLVHIPL